MAEVAVIGGGQAGLSAGYYLKKAGANFTIFDHGSGPGGAWRERWPSLTLRAANRVHDLPGWGLQEALGTDCDDIPAATGVAEYFGAYEKRFELPVLRPAHIRSVTDQPDGRFRIDYIRDGHTETRAVDAVINCTGTWERPFWPTIKGAATFRGHALHAHEYRTAEPFAGKRVVVIGAGITAVQLLLEVAALTSPPGRDTLWVSRRKPDFDDTPFSADKGRLAVAQVEDRVRRGLPPGSVVSVTGLPVSEPVREGLRNGVLSNNPMFDEIVGDGVRWNSGRTEHADVLLWCTGFRAALDHLAPLKLRGPGGGIVMTGRLATEVAGRPRLHLLGYGPSASTIGANRAGREAARAVLAALPG